MLLAQTLVFALLAYVGCGLLVGVPFVTFGAWIVDEAARGSGVGFRLLILPACVALWPLVAARWWAAVRGDLP